MKKKEVKIREFIESDKQVLAEMYCRLNTETFNWMPQSSFSLKDFEKDTEGEEILVAEKDENILGFTSLKRSENLIHQLYVDTNAQGLGLGKKLLDAVIQLSESRLISLNCRVKNEGALGFYANYGFEVDSEFTQNSDLYYRLIYKK